MEESEDGTTPVMAVAVMPLSGAVVGGEGGAGALAAAGGRGAGEVGSDAGHGDGYIGGRSREGGAGPTGEVGVNEELVVGRDDGGRRGGSRRGDGAGGDVDGLAVGGELRAGSDAAVGGGDAAAGGAGAPAGGAGAAASGVEIDELAGGVGDDEGGAVGRYGEDVAGDGRIFCREAVARRAEGHEFGGAAHVDAGAVGGDDHRGGHVGELDGRADGVGGEVHGDEIARLGAGDVEEGAVGAGRGDVDGVGDDR